MTQQDTQTNAKDAFDFQVVHGAGQFWPLAVFWFGAFVSVAHIWLNLFSTVPTLVQNGFHFAGFVILAGALPLALANVQRTWGASISFALSVLVALSVLWFLMQEDAIHARGGQLEFGDWVSGGVLIVGVLYFTWRLAGWIIPALILIALSYAALWGAHIEGLFRFPGLSLETILLRSIYGDDALFGNIALISSSFVFLFILFGAFLLKSGAADFIIRLSETLAGRFIGGPGLVAVFSSALTGTVSGSAIANTASTGVITIPMMQKSGFRRTFAGGVEAAASTGGQLMPPIMGAGAFVMAATTQVPYGQIVMVSILPAILYFFTVAVFVRIEAKRQGVQAQLMPERSESAASLLRRGGLSFVLPMGTLIGLLVWGFTPTTAAGLAIVACIVASWFSPEYAMGPQRICEALVLGARNMVMTAVLLCAVGLIVNIITTAGIGNTFSLMIVEWAHGNLFVAIILVALASLVLGMGLPVTAAYIVLATLSAPALYQMILDMQLVEQLTAGSLPETAKAFFVLADPQNAVKLAGPLAHDAAVGLVGSLPFDVRAVLYEQALPATALTVALLSAHMIVFWLSQDSNVTPPVCLAAFTAAAIAKAKPMATGVAAWKIAKGLYIIPFLFAYTPILSGDVWQACIIALFAVFGLLALAAALEGYFEEALNWPLRLAVAMCGVLLLYPAFWGWKLIGVALLALLLGGNLVLKARRQQQ